MEAARRYNTATHHSTCERMVASAHRQYNKKAGRHGIVLLRTMKLCETASRISTGSAFNSVDAHLIAFERRGRGSACKRGREKERAMGAHREQYGTHTHTHTHVRAFGMRQSTCATWYAEAEWLQRS